MTDNEIMQIENRKLQLEKEMLEIKVNALTDCLNKQAEYAMLEIKKQEAKIKKQDAEIRKLHNTTFGVDFPISSIKAEAFKEIADEINTRIEKIPQQHFSLLAVAEIINEVLTEKVGVDNG